MFNKIVKWLLLGGLVATLSHCGFRLRGEFSLPANIKTIQLTTTAHNKALKRTIEKRLKSYKLNIVDSDSPLPSTDMRLVLLPDELDRRLLSLFTTGQVAEYELVYTVKYTLQYREQEAQALEFTVTREYQDDPDAVLAKSRELDLVLGEMRQQAADRIIRQISINYPDTEASGN